SEDGGVITYTVTLSGAPGSVAPKSDLTFTLANGQDVTIKAGDTSGSVTTTINADDVYKETDSVSTSISSVKSGGSEYESLVLDKTAVTTTITDDSDAVTAKLSADAAVSEDGGVITYTVTLSGAPGAVAPKSDLTFTLANGQDVTIKAGDTSGSVTTTINADDVYKETDSVSTSISSV